MISRPLTPCNGNDKVYTPSSLAELIINHFKPTGKILEPCRGKGAFSNLMPNCDWCEIDEGKDFFTIEGHWDWLVTNPLGQSSDHFSTSQCRWRIMLCFFALSMRCLCGRGCVTSKRLTLELWRFFAFLFPQNRGLKQVLH